MSEVTVDEDLPPQLQKQLETLNPGGVKQIVLSNKREYAVMEWNDFIHLASLAGLKVEKKRP